MQIRSILISIALISIFSSCDNNQAPDAVTPENVVKDDTIKRAFIPVTDFIKGQLHEINSMPVSPLRIVTRAGKSDSTWLKNTDIQNFATAFLNPVIDSAHMAAYFTERSFLDQTVNAFTFTYEPVGKLPDSMQLSKWDLYIDPQTEKIRRIYMVKILEENGQQVQQQLTWKTGTSMKIVNIKELPGKKAEIEEQEIIWNFD